MPSYGPRSSHASPPVTLGNDQVHTAHGSTPTRISGARLLKRVFEIDIEHCPHCGGRLKIIAAIEDPAVIVGILTHPQLARARPAAIPGTGVPLFQAA